MPPTTAPALTDRPSLVAKLFALCFGSFLGLALLKFSTPSVMAKFLDSPANGWEWLIFPWPLRIAYPLLGLLAACGLFVLRWRAFAPKWLMAMPLIWFGWQLISATQSIDLQLSQGVLLHFAGCLVCFYLGATTLTRQGLHSFFFTPILIAFVMVVANGFTQHFGGLQRTRNYFWTYVYPTLPSVPPEYLAKMKSDRIFSTVFYPNAFAGALLLLLPVLGIWIWQGKSHFTAGARIFLCVALGLSTVACLYWTGSKGGWLLALLLGFIALLQQPLSKRIKLTLIAILVLGGGLGFAWKTRDYMKRGATSVVARFDYWRAAGQTAMAKPVFGSGPATFAIAYQAVKRPESEMARLTHNDYLQQASDSGFPGFIAYGAFIVGWLWLGYHRVNWQSPGLAGGVWLGLLAWSVQSAFEFTLYVPSLAWPAFALAGWLLGNSSETNRQNSPLLPNLSSR